MPFVDNYKKHLTKTNIYDILSLQKHTEDLNSEIQQGEQLIFYVGNHFCDCLCFIRKEIRLLVTTGKLRNEERDNYGRLMIQRTYVSV